ncbi:glycosyltransferase family 4 protein [Desulfogranum mediterraneum]|uniref:glycosyltransferase family 4 protein n=1 Tax=Desulfogranum mediterraneum TaxID=160661 RepID=UPI000491A53C|nr:glycosyltransferase family 4 protein [Desulfogranum mediterraneum]
MMGGRAGDRAAVFPSGCRVAHILAAVEFGGAEKVSLTFFRNVDRQKVEVYPILLVRPWEEDGLLVKELQRAGYVFARVPVAKRPSREGRDFFRLLRCARRIYAELKDGCFDLVHTHGYFADIIGGMVARWLKIPVVSTCHGFISLDAKLSLYNTLDIMALRLMHQVITVSERIKSDLVERGLAGDRVEVVQNAVESAYGSSERSRRRADFRSSYGLGEDELVLGYVGRLSAEKGVLYLLEAVAQLGSSGHQVRLVVVGDGPQRKEVESFVQARDLAARVILAGFQEDVSALLPGLDIFVLPSLTEGTSMALLEAMAAGLPVIATAVGGTPRVITSGQNGILIEAQSADAIVDAVFQLAADPQLVERVGEAAMERVLSEFGVDSWLQAIEDVYAKVLVGARGSGQAPLESGGG